MGCAKKISQGKVWYLLKRSKYLTTSLELILLVDYSHGVGSREKLKTSMRYNV